MTMELRWTISMILFLIGFFTCIGLTISEIHWLDKTRKNFSELCEWCANFAEAETQRIVKIEAYLENYHNETAKFMSDIRKEVQSEIRTHVMNTLQSRQALERELERKFDQIEDSFATKLTLLEREIERVSGDKVSVIEDFETFVPVPDFDVDDALAEFEERLEGEIKAEVEAERAILELD